MTNLYAEHRNRVSSEMLGWIRSAKEAEQRRKDAAAEKKTAVEQIKNWTGGLREEDPEYALPNGVTVKPVKDIEIEKDHQARVARVLLELSEHLPNLLDCVEIKIDTKKLAEVVDFNGQVNPMVAHLPMTLTTSEELSVSVGQLVDEQTMQEKQSSTEAWAKSILEDGANNPVLLHIDATDFEGMPVHVCIEDLVSGVRWSKLMNPGVSIKTEAALYHGIDDKIVEDAPTVADMWGTVLDKLDGRKVIVWSEATKTIFENACVVVTKMRTVKSIDFIVLQQLYSDYHPLKMGKNGQPGAWWSWKETLKNEPDLKTDIDYIPPRELKTAQMARLIAVMAGADLPAETEVDIQVQTMAHHDVEAVPVEVVEKGEDPVAETDGTPASQQRVDDIPF